jgi:competence protein ComEA
MKIRYSVLLLVLCVVLAVCQQTAPIVVVPPPTAAPTWPPTSAPMRVYVSGAVATPGVYVLPPKSLVEDALKAAGGAAADADLEKINLAQEVRDQQQIHVPRKGEAVPQQPAPGPGSAATPSSPVAKKVNINTATLADLDTLPKVGPITAQKIIDYRVKNGPFKRIEDLKNVSGIGDATFEGLEDLITIEP